MEVTLMPFNIIDRKYTHIIFSFFMALAMSCVISLAITLFNIGLIEGIIWIWFQAWLHSFFIAFPAALAISPLVTKIVNVIIKKEGEKALQRR